MNDGETPMTTPARPTTPDLRSRLQAIFDHGYQPMYNGRPSCPFCHNFVDEEETHTHGCALRAVLAAQPEPGLPDFDALSQAMADANVWKLADKSETTDTIARAVLDSWPETPR